MGVEILEIPFVDSSSLQTKNDQENVRTNLESILKLLDEYNVSLSLETDLPPKQFRDFLLSFEHPKMKANYDVGNSAGLGYDMKEEFKNFGKLITNVHIKDREYSGNTVPLGTGNVDFPLFFKLLKQNNYSGDFIIQGARESGIDSGFFLPEESLLPSFIFSTNTEETFFYPINFLGLESQINLTPSSLDMP